MVQSTTGTLIKPPPTDPSKSLIENVLELTPIADIGPDIFTNTRPLWHPPGARGIYGGAAIAQSLAAAQLTIPPPSAANKHASFLVHSMHCYFVLAGDSNIPVLYHVERVREGKSFMTRTVQARQRGKCIFTTTVSFVREGSAGEEVVAHEVGIPRGVEEELEGFEGEEGGEGDDERFAREEREKQGDGKEAEAMGEQGRGPFETRRMEITNSSSPNPETKRTHTWLRARGRISSTGPQAHLSALAYMSDSYFIGTISRVHGLWRFGRPRQRAAMDAWDKSLSSSKRLISSTSPPNRAPTGPEVGGKPDATSPDQKNPYSNAFPPSSSSSPSSKSPPSAVLAAHKEMASLESRENAPDSNRQIGMMVSLDHTIFFHRPRAVRADEWLFSEMESPWTGDGRGLVMQRIWDRRGRLVATCVQEGLCRLVQTGNGVEERVMGKL